MKYNAIAKGKWGKIVIIQNKLKKPKAMKMPHLAPLFMHLPLIHCAEFMSSIWPKWLFRKTQQIVEGHAVSRHPLSTNRGFSIAAPLFF